MTWPRSAAGGQWGWDSRRKCSSRPHHVALEAGSMSRARWTQVSKDLSGDPAPHSATIPPRRPSAPHSATTTPHRLSAPRSATITPHSPSAPHSAMLTPHRLMLEPEAVRTWDRRARHHTDMATNTAIQSDSDLCLGPSAQASGDPPVKELHAADCSLDRPVGLGQGGGTILSQQNPWASLQRPLGSGRPVAGKARGSEPRAPGGAPANKGRVPLAGEIRTTL